MNRISKIIPHPLFTLVAAALALASAAGSGLAADAAAEAVHPAQAGLAEAIRDAAPLKMEKLMKGPESVWDQHMFWVPNRDGKTWDVFFIYSPGYLGPHEVYVLDTGSGELKRQMIERGFGFHLVPKFLIDGKMYFKPSINPREGEAVYVYDPDKNELIFGGRPMGSDIESAFGGAWALEEGTIYGFGRVRGKGGEPDLYAPYRIDAKSLKGEILNSIGEVHDNHNWLYSSLHKEGEWLYAKVGKAPWRLWGYNLATGAGRLLVETEVFDGNHRTIHVRPLEEPGGFQVDVDRPRGKGAGVASFWLKDGELTEKAGDTPPWSNKPLAGQRRAKEPSFPKPEMLRTPPDAEGNVKLQWRNGRNDEWRTAEFNVIRHDVPLRRMAALPDGRIFGLGESYAQAVIYDVAKNQRIRLGRTMSVYSMTAHDGLVYMSGYAGAVVWKYDPARPWTVNTGLVNIGEGAADEDEQTDLTRPESNPREVARLQRETRMQNPWGGTIIGGDGRVYAAGWIIRVGHGGALGWWDPKTDTSGGLTDPFSAYPIYWMCGVSDGSTGNRYLALSTKPTRDDKNPEYTPPQGKVFIFDTAGQKIIREIVPTSQGFHGPVIEAAPGVVMGCAKAPGDGEGGLLWAADVVTGKLLWTRAAPVAPVTSFAMMRRNAGTILQHGPDGKVWTFMGKTLVRIAPDDGRVEVVGSIPNGEAGELTFVNGQIYLAGDTALRRIDLN